MTRARIRNLAVLVAAAATALIVWAAPAGATVVDKGHYSGSYSESFDDCGFEVVVEGTGSGHYRIRAGKRDTDTAFFLNDNYSYAETLTNPATGAFVTITAQAVFNEIRATPIGGSVFQFDAVEAGQPFTVYDADGNLVVRERGVIVHHVLFDTEGDDVPGGIEIEYLGADVHGPHPAFDTEFCDVITPLIGS